MSRLSSRLSELPDPRDPELAALAREAAGVYNDARRETRLDEFGESLAWLAVDEMCFTLSVLHNAWLEMKPKLAYRRLPPWPEAQRQIAASARLAYDTLLLTIFSPSGSTLTRPSFSMGYGYGQRNAPPPRSVVEPFACEALEWWWLSHLREMAETRLPKGCGTVLDRVPVLRRAPPNLSTPLASPSSPISPTARGCPAGPISPILSPATPDSSRHPSRESSISELPSGYAVADPNIKLELDDAYAHKSLHAVIGWRANAQLGVLALHVERARWVWYSDFRDSKPARRVLEEEGVSPLLSQVGLPGMLRGDAQPAQ